MQKKNKKTAVCLLCLCCVQDIFVKRKAMNFILSENKLKSRLIIIGDVHGCFEELKSLLNECLFNELEDILIFVGDLVNKGPNSVEVIRYVRDLSLKEVAYSVIGNHDEAMIEMSKRDSNTRPRKYAYIDDLIR